MNDKYLFALGRGACEAIEDEDFLTGLKGLSPVDGAFFEYNKNSDSPEALVEAVTGWSESCVLDEVQAAVVSVLDSEKGGLDESRFLDFLADMFEATMCQNEYCGEDHWDFDTIEYKDRETEEVVAYLPSSQHEDNLVLGTDLVLIGEGKSNEILKALSKIKQSSQGWH